MTAITADITDEMKLDIEDAFLDVDPSELMDPELDKAATACIVVILVNLA